MPTSLGDSRLWWHPSPGPASAVLILGHGAGRGVDTADLQALAAALPTRGVSVALVDQPWVVAGRKVAAPPARLDQAFGDVVPRVLERVGSGIPSLVGGRSAGARVACRTAAGLGAVGVVALAFPLHPPGRPGSSRAGELAAAGVPVLVVQGGRDAFGSPGEVRAAVGAAARTAVGAAARTAAGPVAVEVVELGWADHSLRVPARAPVTAEQTLARLVDAVEMWVATVVG